MLKAAKKITFSPWMDRQMSNRAASPLKNKLKVSLPR